jgi:hypothetical protein
MKKLILLLMVASVVLLTTGTVQASTSLDGSSSFKDLDAADSLWSNAANWDDGLPVAGDWAQIQKSGTLNSDAGSVLKVTIGYNDGTALTVVDGGLLSMDQDLVPGRNGSGTLNMEGGTVNIGRDLDLGYSDGKMGLVTMSGGTINITRDLGLLNGGGQGLHSAQLDMTGGFIYVGDDLDMNEALGLGATGLLNLDGGSIILTNVYETNSRLQMAAGCAVLNFGGGTLVLPGNRVGEVGGFFSSGYITSDLGGISAIYDDVNTTVIGVVPEPATMILLGLGGLLMRKRR